MDRNQIIAIATAVTDRYLEDTDVDVWMSDEGAICIRRKEGKDSLTFRMKYSPTDEIVYNHSFLFVEALKNETILYSKAFNLESYEKVYGAECCNILTDLIMKDINIVLGTDGK